MATQGRRQFLPGPEYRISITFPVPLDFAYAWCTDFSPEDGKLEGESFERNIIERKAGRVIYEDLEETSKGWIWSRSVVTLRPPRRWHMDGVGNQRDVTADYLLTPLSGDRTKLDLRWKRRATNPTAAKLTKAKREAASLRNWKRFRAAMERDYERARRRSGGK